MGYSIQKHSLKSFFDGFDELCIGSYQRRYRWNDKQLKALMDDIGELQAECSSDPRADHMFGSVCILKNKHLNRNEIVDGQQRVTSITLLMKVIHQYLDQNQEIDAHLKRISLKSLSDFFTNQEISEPSCKLKTLTIDQHQYESIILGPRDRLSDEAEDAIIENRCLNFAYEYFKRYLVDKKSDYVSLLELTRLIMDRVFVNVIIFDNAKDVHKLFEIINDRGLPLTQADLIKNFVFKYVATHCVGDYARVEGLWTQIIQNLDKLPQNFDHDIFFRQYLLGCFQAVVAQSKIAVIFKRYFIHNVEDASDHLPNVSSDLAQEVRDEQDELDGDDESADVIEQSPSTRSHSKEISADVTAVALVEKILQAAIQYTNIINRTTDHLEINRALYNLSCLRGVRPSYILILNLLTRGTLTKSPDGISLVCRSIWMIEVFLIRFIICKGRTQTLDRTFAAACDFKDDDLDVSLYAHLTNPKKGAFPDDAFRDHLRAYDFDNRNKLDRAKYLLAVLEQKNNEVLVLEQQPAYSEVEVEHIIPGALADIQSSTRKDHNWEGQLGEDWAKSVIESVSKIGNLTLLESDLNGEAKDKMFQEQREIYLKSRSNAVADIRIETNFDYETLKRRSSKLAEEICAHWGYEPRSL